MHCDLSRLIEPLYQFGIKCLENTPPTPVFPPGCIPLPRPQYIVIQDGAGKMTLTRAQNPGPAVAKWRQRATEMRDPGFFQISILDACC